MCADHGEARVSQGGEGRPRRVTPEEGLRLTLTALREGRADIATQRGWDLAREHMLSISLSQIDWLERLVVEKGPPHSEATEVLGTLRALRAELTREDGPNGD